MSKNVYFKPDWYKITKIIGSNVVEVDDTWLIKLEGINDNTPETEIRKWLKVSNYVRIIPYERDKYARIISDVWLGNTHINRQFSGYKTKILEK